MKKRFGLGSVLVVHCVVCQGWDLSFEFLASKQLSEYQISLTACLLFTSPVSVRMSGLMLKIIALDELFHISQELFFSVCQLNLLVPS